MTILTREMNVNVICYQGLHTRTYGHTRTHTHVHTRTHTHTHVHTQTHTDNQYLLQLDPNTDHKQEVTYMYSIKEICFVMITYWTFGRCDYQLVLNINPKTLDKGERLEYGESMITHAMVLNAVSEKQVNYAS